jgi:hypothetical protein
MRHKTTRSITLAGRFSKGPGAPTVTLNGNLTYLGQFRRKRGDAKPLFIEFQFLVRSILNCQATFEGRLIQHFKCSTMSSSMVYRMPLFLPACAHQVSITPSKLIPCSVLLCIYVSINRYSIYIHPQ